MFTSDHHACLILVARKNYATLEINPKLELNSDFASGGQGKNKGRQSETLTKFYQNYLLEQRTVEYLSVKKPILGARMSATVSACLSLEKYFCSFSNKISYIS